MLPILVLVFALISLENNVTCSNSVNLTINQRLCLEELNTVYNGCLDFESCLYLAFINFQYDMNIWDTHNAAYNYYILLRETIRPGNIKTPEEYCSNDEKNPEDYSDPLNEQRFVMTNPSEIDHCREKLESLFAPIKDRIVKQDIIRNVFYYGSGNPEQYNTEWYRKVLRYNTTFFDFYPDSLDDNSNTNRLIVNYVIHVANNVAKEGLLHSPLVFCQTRTREYFHLYIRRPIE